MDEMEAEATSGTACYQADEEAKSAAKSSSEQASRLESAREDNDGPLAVEGANEVATKPVVADSTELAVTAPEEIPIVVAKQRRSSRSRVPTPEPVEMVDQATLAAKTTLESSFTPLTEYIENGKPASSRRDVVILSRTF